MSQDKKFQPRPELEYAKDVPDDWDIKKLKRFFSVSSGNFLSPSEESESGFPIFGGNGLRGYTEEYNCSGKTLLIGRVGAKCGNVKLVDGEFWYSEHALKVFPLSNFSLKFMRYLIEDIDLNQFANRTAQPLINSKITIDRYAAFPMLAEQKRIAEYLDSSCLVIDSAVSLKKHQSIVLDGLRKKIIQRVVTRGLAENVELIPTGNNWLGKIPNGWKLKALKRLATLQTGLTLGKQYEGSLIERPYLRVANVQDGSLALESVTTIEVTPAVAASVELKPDDVLMTEGGDLDKLGRGYLWEGQIPGCLHQNHIFSVRCIRHLLLPSLLAYVTSSPYGRDYFEATGKRTTNLASTNSTKVKAFPVPLPPIAEQKRLVAYLDEKLGDLDRLKDSLNQQIQTLLAYRKSLIHECVTGKRRITEEDVARVSRTFN